MILIRGENHIKTCFLKGQLTIKVRVVQGTLKRISKNILIVYKWGRDTKIKLSRNDSWEILFILKTTIMVVPDLFKFRYLNFNTSQCGA